MATDQAQERRSNWNFVITDGGWLWTLTRPDGIEQKSNRTFKTLKQCADDAIQHGYGAWKAEERRRIEGDFGDSEADNA